MESRSDTIVSGYNSIDERYYGVTSSINNNHLPKISYYPK